MYSKEEGGIAWVDLTVPKADQLREFYQQVVGFESESLSMGDYDDYVMKSTSDPDAQVGICHARGVNADLPPQWLIYFNVADIDRSIQQCLAAGGELLREKSDMGDSHLCVIKDPAGAVAALVSKK